MSRLIEQLKRHEGFSNKPYNCTSGALTIGYGRNIESNGISETEALVLLNNDVISVKRQLRQRVSVYNSNGLSLTRRAVLENMAFNLGVTGLLGFKKMLAAIQVRDYELAAIEMLDSKWARQVGSRANELSQQMKTGKWV